MSGAPLQKKPLHQGMPAALASLLKVEGRGCFTASGAMHCAL